MQRLSAVRPKGGAKLASTSAQRPQPERDRASVEENRNAVCGISNGFQGNQGANCQIQPSGNARDSLNFQNWNSVSSVRTCQTASHLNWKPKRALMRRWWRLAAARGGPTLELRLGCLNLQENELSSGCGKEPKVRLEGVARLLAVTWAAMSMSAGRRMRDAPAAFAIGN